MCNEAHMLIIRKIISETLLTLSIRNENQLVTRGLCNAFSNKTAVAASGKVENHFSEILLLCQYYLFTSFMVSIPLAV